MLQKADTLNSLENQEIKKHPDMGARIVEGVPSLKGLADMVRHHHERYDGNGYGAGLKGEAIPLESRILAIADAYDAMTTARAYRGAIESDDAIEEIMLCAGTQFDPALVEKFDQAARADFDE